MKVQTWQYINEMAASLEDKQVDLRRKDKDILPENPHYENVTDTGTPFFP